MANPPLQPTPIGNGVPALQEIGAFLQDAEGYKPYVYNDSRGFASIGIGLNLEAPYTLALALQEMGVFSAIQQDPSGSGTLAQQFQAAFDTFANILKSNPLTASTKNQKASQEERQFTDQQIAEVTTLQAQLNAAVQTYLGPTATFSLTLPQAQKAVTDYLQGFQLGDNSGITSLITTIGNTKPTSFPTTGSLKQVNNFLSGYQIFQGQLATTSTSAQYLAALDLSYAGLGTFLDTNVFRTALASNNRAEIWYVIREDFNGNGLTGLAARHMAGADIFGLYNDPNNVTIRDATEVYQMVTAHRSSLIAYETKWGELPGLPNPVKTDAVAAARGSYQDLLKNGVIPTDGGNRATAFQLAQELLPAENAVIQWIDTSYGANNAATSAINTTSFNSVNVFFGADGQSLDLSSATILGTGGAIIIGGSGNISLVGNNGNDVVIAGSGDDKLTSGGGNTTLIGGAGIDTFNLSKAGNTTVLAELTANVKDVINVGLATMGAIYVQGAAGGSLTPILGTVANESPHSGTNTSGLDLIWNTSAGTYEFTGDADSATGTLKVTGIAGAASGSSLQINGFNLAAAESSSGFLGIKLDGGSGTNVGTAPNGAIKGKSGGDPPQGVLSLTTSLAGIATTAESVAISMEGDDSGFGIEYQGQFLAFSGGAIDLTVPAFASSITYGLVNIADVTSDEEVTLSVSIVGGADDPSTCTVDYTAAAVDTSQDPTTTRTIQGTGQGWGPTSSSPGLSYDGDNANDAVTTASGNNYVSTGDGDSVIHDGGTDIVDVGDGNNVIAGSGNQLILVAGNGDNRIYSGSEISEGAAILGAQNGTAQNTTASSIFSTQDGDDTIVASTGNDFVSNGTGDSLIVLGKGNDTYTGGIDVFDATPQWSVSTQVDGYDEISELATGLDSAADLGSPPPDNYQGAYWDFTNVGEQTVGGGDDSIFAGSGQAFILLSNGDNYVQGSSGTMYAFGGMGDDTLNGGSGASTIFGGGGDDYISGGSGNDYLVGNAGDNTIFGGSGNDTIFAGDSDLEPYNLDGYEGNYYSSQTGSNYVEAGSGNDLIYGSGGDDTLVGGTGSATLVAGDGNEDLIAGNGNADLVGNQFDSQGSDTLDASGSGNDSIFAGNSNVTIYGGSGTDTISAGAGTLVAYLGDGGTVVAPTQLTLGSGDATVTGGDGIEQIEGGSGDALIYVGNGGDASGRTSVEAGSGATTVYGGNGSDAILGGSGVDVLYAGDGGSTDSPTKVEAGSGSATIYGGAGVDQLLASDSGDVSIVGGSGIETLQGGGGNDTLVAGTDQDTINVLGSATTVEFTQNTGSVDIPDFGIQPTYLFDSGISASDLTVTAAFADDGNASLVLEYGDDMSVSIEGGLSNPSESFQFADAGTVDLAQLLTAANVESVDIADPDGTGDLVFGADSNSTVDGGDEGDGGSGNDTVSEYGSGNTVLAGGGADQIDSAGDNNQVIGGAGSDTLDASGNNDTLTAGAGATTFVVNNSNATIEAPEPNSANQVLSSVSWTLGANLQSLTLTGAQNIIGRANDLNDTLTGGDGYDTLIGGGGADSLVGGASPTVMIGGSGIDIFIVNNGADVVDNGSGNSASTVLSSVDYLLPENVSSMTLTGSADLSATSNSVGGMITGNAGNDTLTAGFGTDTLVAGPGVDTLIAVGGTTTFEVNNSSDVVQLVGYYGYQDTIQSSVNYALPDYIDTLELTGSANLAGRSNSSGGTVEGNAGNDTLYGGSGYDTLIAGSGIDTLVGGTGYGQTTFVVNNSQDVIQDTGGRNDVIESSVSYVAPANVATLELTGSANLTATASAHTSTLEANTGNDTLIGSSGTIAMYGGPGTDTFDVGSGAATIESEKPSVIQLGSGFGATEIVGSGGDTLQFGTGIALSAVSVSASLSDNEPSLVISVAGQNSITIAGGLLNAADTFEFADGGTVSLTQLLQQSASAPETITGYQGNLEFTSASDSTLQGGSGTDTLLAYGAADTVVAGTGAQNLFGAGEGDTLIAGPGDDTLTASTGDADLVAGVGNSTLIGGQASDNYILVAGGITQIESNTVSGVENIALPEGDSLAGFAAIQSGVNLILQSRTDQTSAIIEGYFAAQPANRQWLISSDTDAPQSLSDWVSAQVVSPETETYAQEASNAELAFQSQLNPDLTQLGTTGGTLGSLNDFSGGASYYDDPTYGYVDVENYTFTINQSAGSLPDSATALPGSESDSTSVATTAETITLTKPVYGEVTIPGTEYQIAPGQGFDVPWGDYYEFLPNGNVEIISPPQIVQEQVGTTTYTETLYENNATVDRTFTNYTLSVGSDNKNVDLAMPSPFVGTITLGDGNDQVGSIASSSADWVQGARYYPPGNYGQALRPQPAGAYIQAGAGNDTIGGTSGNDVLVAGSGFDVMDGGAGADKYLVPLNGTASELIADSGEIQTNLFQEQIYGGSFPLDTLVLPSGITLGDLSYHLFNDVSNPGQQILELSYGNSNVLIEFTPNSLFEMQPNGAMKGVDQIQFADGTQISIQQLISEVSLQTNDKQFSLASSGEALTAGQTVALESLFSVHNPSGDTVLEYEVTNTSQGTVSIDGTAVAASAYQPLYLSASQLADATYTAGASESGALKLTAISVQAGPVTGEVDFGPQSTGPVQAGAHLTIGEFATAPVTSFLDLSALGDVAGDTFNFIDEQTGPGTLKVNGTAVTGIATVAGDDLASVQFVGGSASGSDLIEVSVSQLNSSFSSYTPVEIATTGGNVIQGDSSGTTVVGTAGQPDTLIGGYAGDTLVGGGSADLFIYRSGSGPETISEANSAGTLQFGAGIDPSSLSLTTVSGALVIHVGQSGDSITIDGFDPTNAFGSGQIQQFNFEDGASLTYPQLLELGINITGGSGDIQLSGTNAYNRITAGSGSDTLLGAGVADTLIGGSSADTLIGGTGQETFVVDNPLDVVQQTAGNAFDAVVSSINFVLPANIDTLTLTGAGALLGTGNADADLITGNTGSDTLVSGSGVDTLIGNSGNDVFVVNNAEDSIQENVSGTSSILSSADYVLPQNVASLTLTGFDDLSAASNDSGGVLTGNSGSDTLTGGSGADTLISGSGTDLLIGGGGNETFVINNSSDTVDAALSGVSQVLSSVSYVEPENVSSLTLTGIASLTATGNDQDGTLNANAGNDTLISGSGVQTLVGGTGADTFEINNTSDVVEVNGSGASLISSVSYVVPSDIASAALSGSDSLTLTAQADTQSLMANSGNDTLVSSTGIETLVGGTGNDTYVVNNASDQIIAQSGASGTVLASVSYVLPEDVSTLILTGSSDLSATGNSSNDILEGNAGADTLIAGSGSAVMVGGSGNDTMVGGSGIDTMIGGSGADLFEINNADDQVSAGTGSDTIQSSVDFVLPEHVDTLQLTGSASLIAGGNGENDLLIANTGNDTIFAGAGIDTFVGGIGQDSFDGGIGDTYQFATGFGSAEIADARNGIISFGTGISVSDITVSQDTQAGAEALVLTDGTSSITVDQGLIGAVSTIEFANGASLNVANLIGTDAENSFAAAAANQLVTATTQQADTVTGGFDGDTLVGGNTDDTFVVPAGSGTTTISETGPSASLQFGPGVSQDELSLSFSSGQLVISDGAGDTVNVNGFNPDDALGSGALQYVGFANGQTESYAELLSQGFNVYAGSGNVSVTGTDLTNRIYGADGNDTLMGSGTADTLISGTGNDSMIGGTGQNSFYYEIGDGQDTINDSTNAGGSHAGADILQFGSDITAQSLNFVQSGNGVLITDGSFGDSILFEGLDTSSTTPIDKLEFSDGSYSSVTSDGSGDLIVENFDSAGGSLGYNTISSNGSNSSQYIDPTTRETTGSVSTVGAAYSYTYDTTYATDGSVEQKVDFTFTDGSTLDTDTVYDPDGSYQKVAVQSDGSATTQNLVASTGELTGTDSIAGVGYTDAYDDTKLSSGATESKVTDTYPDGSTYYTDTIEDTDGSVQQSTLRSDGSATQVDYVASTGEISGGASVTGAGYTFTFDDTKLSNGATEDKIDYTYPDGSTLDTDTVTDADGSYQQSTVKNDGSTTTTDYVASTGEISGSVDTTGAAYSYTYDDTKLSGGATESKVDYTYPNGSTLSTDTVVQADGSFQENAVGSDGSTAQANYVAATGEVYGSGAPANAGYTYTFDDTKLTNGGSESKVTDIYANGSSYTVDTITNPDGTTTTTTSSTPPTGGGGGGTMGRMLRPQELIASDEAASPAIVSGRRENPLTPTATTSQTAISAAVPTIITAVAELDSSPVTVSALSIPDSPALPVASVNASAPATLASIDGSAISLPASSNAGAVDEIDDSSQMLGAAISSASTVASEAAVDSSVINRQEVPPSETPAVSRNPGELRATQKPSVQINSQATSQNVVSSDSSPLASILSGDTVRQMSFVQLAKTGLIAAVDSETKRGPSSELGSTVGKMVRPTPLDQTEDDSKAVVGEKFNLRITVGKMARPIMLEGTSSDLVTTQNISEVNAARSAVGKMVRPDQVAPTTADSVSRTGEVLNPTSIGEPIQATSKSASSIPVAGSSVHTGTSRDAFITEGVLKQSNLVTRGSMLLEDWGKADSKEATPRPGNSPLRLTQRSGDNIVEQWDWSTVNAVPAAGLSGGTELQDVDHPSTLGSVRLATRGEMVHPLANH